MNRDELRSAWIAALRSGKYKQGTGRLREEDRYCCLGVLYEVAGVEAVEVENTGDYLYEDRGQILSETMKDRVGLRSKGGAGKDGAHLISMNDAGTPFPKIADALETGNFWVYDK